MILFNWTSDILFVWKVSNYFVMVLFSFTSLLIPFPKEHNYYQNIFVTKCWKLLYWTQL